MLRYLPIRKIHARQILDSRGNPYCGGRSDRLENALLESMDIQAVQRFHPARPTGKFEALEAKRRQTKGNYKGLSVQKAVDNVNTKITEAILGENALDQTYIDSLLIQTDGTDNKSNLGANATLAVSMAVARQLPWRFESRFISILAAVMQTECRFL